MVAELFPLLFGKFPNYYELLGLTCSASKQEINSAYKKVALKQHPDKAGNTAFQNELFAAINNAKVVLSDDTRRSTYESELRRRHHPIPRPHQPASHPPKQSASYDFSTAGSTFDKSSRGPRYSSSPHIKPFGSGGGFDPERRASKEDPGHSGSRSRSSASGSHDYNPDSPCRRQTYRPACPSCGSQFCTGSRYSDQQNRDYVTCFNLDAASQTFNATGSSGDSQSRRRDPSSEWDRNNLSFSTPQQHAPGPGSGSQSGTEHTPGAQCDGDPDRCPLHNSNHFQESTYWKSPSLEGDAQYVDHNRPRPFQSFIPPASAYGRYGHCGTEPGSPMWRQARWKCFNLSEEHKKTTVMALSLCDCAVETARILQNLAQRCMTYSRLGVEQSRRAAAALELVNEMMHFAAGGYRYCALMIDGAIYRQPSIAVPVFLDTRRSLEVISAVISGTNTLLNALADLMSNNVTGIDAMTFARGVRTIIVGWDLVVLLPGNIMRGVQDVFYAKPGGFENDFERRGKSTSMGYPTKPFMYKMSVAEALSQCRHVCSRQDEESILRRWETAQRTREAQRKQEAEAEQAYAAPWGASQWGASRPVAHGGGGHIASEQAGADWDMRG